MYENQTARVLLLYARPKLSGADGC